MSNKLARLLEATVVTAALLTIPLILVAEQNPGAAWAKIADWVVWTVFLVEYAVMLGTSPKPRLYIKRNPLNLAVIVFSYPQLPMACELVRLARLGRVVRLLRLVSVTARAIAALRAVFCRRGLLSVAAISCFVIVAGGAALALLEPQTVRGGVIDGV